MSVGQDQDISGWEAPERLPGSGHSRLTTARPARARRPARLHGAGRARAQHLPSRSAWAPFVKKQLELHTEGLAFSLAGLVSLVHLHAQPFDLVLQFLWAEVPSSRVTLPAPGAPPWLLRATQDIQRVELRFQPTTIEADMLNPPG
jgi:hypothetical protein